MISWILSTWTKIILYFHHVLWTSAWWGSSVNYSIIIKYENLVLPNTMMDEKAVICKFSQIFQSLIGVLTTKRTDRES